jgi:glycerophosphoryl diester phosphodiesterase
MIAQSKLPIPKVIAHRGASAYTPENTLLSMYKASELGATWIEFDVMLTGDGIPIVIHDETLNRTTNGQGIVAETTYADIAKLDAGSWFSPEFSGEKVPKLSEFLKLAHKLGLGVNLEIKATEHTALATGKAVIEEIRQHWQFGHNDFLISSHNIDSLYAFHALKTDIPLALVLETWRPDWQEIVTSLDCVSLNIHHSMLSHERVIEAKKNTEYLLVYTVNDKQLAEHCFDMGADGIFSDCPDVCL